MSGRLHEDATGDQGGELDLDAIEARARDLSSVASQHADTLALVAEVRRLRAERGVEEFTVMGDDAEGGWIVSMTDGYPGRDQAEAWIKEHGEGYVVSRMVTAWQRASLGPVADPHCYCGHPDDRRRVHRSHECVEWVSDDDR